MLTFEDFYGGDPETMRRLADAGLYAVRAAESMEALMLGTVSDGEPGSSDLTADEREATFADMIDLALAALST